MAQAPSLHPLVKEAIERSSGNASALVSLLNRVIVVSVPQHHDLEHVLALEGSLHASDAFLKRVADEITAHEIETSELMARSQQSREALRSATREVQRTEAMLVRASAPPLQNVGSTRRRPTFGRRSKFATRKSRTSTFVSHLPLTQRVHEVQNSPNSFRLTIARTPRPTTAADKDAKKGAVSPSMASVAARIAVQHTVPDSDDIEFDRAFVAANAEKAPVVSIASGAVQRSDYSGNLEHVAEILETTTPGRRSEQQLNIVQTYLRMFGTLIEADADKLRNLANLATLRRSSPGERVIEQGTRVGKVFAIASGAGVYVVREDIYRRNVGVLGVGELFGDRAVVDDCDAMASVVVRFQELVAIVLPARAFIACQKVPPSTLEHIAPLWNLVDNDKDKDRGTVVPNARERVDLACDFIDDAVNNRELRERLPGPLARSVQHLQRSRLYSGAIAIILFSLLGLAFYETPARNASTDIAVRAVESALVLALVLDTLLSALAVEGVRQWWRSGPHRVRAVLLVVIVIDIAVASGVGGRTFRFSRALRPVMLLLHFKVLRRLYMVALRSALGIVPVLTLLSGIMLFYTVVGLHLFHYSRQDVYDAPAIEAGTGVFADACADGKCANVFSGIEFVFDSFSSWSYTLLSLFMLLTTETYPHMTWPAQTANTGYQIYFTSFLLLVVFFMLNVVLSTIYNAFQFHHTQKLLQDRRRERSALHAAFATLDIFGSGGISVTVFDRLLKQLRPTIKNYQVLALYRILDADGDGTLGELEFFQICDTLLLNVRHAELQFDRDVSLRDLRRDYGTRLALRALFERPLYAVARGLFFFADVVVQLLFFLDRSVFGFIDFAFVLLFMLEIGATMFSYGPKRYIKSSAHRLDVVATSVQLVGAVSALVLSEDDARYQMSVLRFAGLIRILHVLIWMNTYQSELAGWWMRLRGGGNKNDNNEKNDADKLPQQQQNEDREGVFLKVVDTFVEMIPPFLFMCMSLIVTIMYSYAVLGMDLFTTAETECSTSAYIQYDPQARFCSLSTAYFALFQIVVATNWHPLMYKAFENHHPLVVALYFTSFFTICVIFVLNLFQAVFIDIFVFSMDHRDQDVEISTVVQSDDMVGDDPAEFPGLEDVWENSNVFSKQPQVMVGQANGWARFQKAVEHGVNNNHAD